MAISLAALLTASPTADTQVGLIVLQASFWFVFIHITAKHVFEPYIASRSWVKQWIDLNRRTFRTALLIELGADEKVLEFGCLFLAILIQHGVGGVLCAPSVFGLLPRATASALARHGALCEAGWELQDSVSRLFQIFFGGQEGRAKNPKALLVIMAMHHVMGLAMVAPMNIMYGDNALYHELVFLLQFAAFAAMVSQNYGYTLDVRSKTGLLQMKVCVTFTFLVMLYSRVIRFGWVSALLFQTLYVDAGGMTALVATGMVSIVAMFMLNILFFLDSVGKFFKFCGMSHAEGTEEVGAALARVSGSFHSRRVPDAEWAKVRALLKMGVLKDGDAATESGEPVADKKTA